MINRKKALIGNDSLPLEDRSLLSAAITHLPRQAEIRSANNHSATPRDFTPRRWQWMADTYWIVPPKGLPAIIFNSQSGKIAPVQDQTVYHITGYRNGYFWGETVAQYSNSGTPSSAAVIGSVTPEGKLLLNFVATDGVTTGVGTMTYKRGTWAMENQMFTGTDTTRIGHWAYMVQVKPGMKAWNNLPFVNVSVPTFLSNYNMPTPAPVF